MDEREKAAVAEYWIGPNERPTPERILAACKKYAAWGQPEAKMNLTDKQWKSLCRDILDRRGLKWEWAKIDDDVKAEIRKAWDKIIFSRSTPAALDAPASAEPPAQPEASTDDVVERMLQVFDETKDQDYNASPQERRTCMTAALAVAREGYAPVTEQRWTREQIEKALRDIMIERCYNGTQAIELSLAVLQRLTAKPERVTVSHAGGIAAIYLDQMLQCKFGNEDAEERERNANRYAAGLRAELEKEKAK